MEEEALLNFYLRLDEMMMKRKTRFEIYVLLCCFLDYFFLQIFDSNGKKYCIVILVNLTKRRQAQNDSINDLIHVYAYK